MTLGKSLNLIYLEEGDRDILLVCFSGCLEDKELGKKCFEKYKMLYDNRRHFKALHMCHYTSAWTSGGSFSMTLGPLLSSPGPFSTDGQMGLPGGFCLASWLCPVRLGRYPRSLAFCLKLFFYMCVQEGFDE